MSCKYCDPGANDAGLGCPSFLHGLSKDEADGSRMNTYAYIHKRQLFVNVTGFCLDLFECADINYCPMCGRDLREGAHGQDRA